MDKNKLDKKKIFKIVLMVYYIISPIFEIVYFYNHVTTFFRVAFILSSVLITVFLYRDSRKNFKYLLFYYMAMMIYLLASFVHSKGFSSLVPGNFNYSIVNEGMTLLKLCMPFSILFILKYVKFTKQEFFRVINSWIIIVAGSIVIFNLCGYSLSSYSNEITHSSIFSWNRNMDVLSSATKGWFTYANQEVIILLMLMVLAVYESLYNSKKYILFVMLVSLGLIMLGTRIGTYGGLLTLGALCITYLAYSFIYKKKLNVWVSVLGVMCLIWFIALPYTPCNARVNEIEEASKTIIKETKSEKEVSQGNNALSDLEIFEQKVNHNLVGKQFYTDFYPYEYDKEFWEEVLDKQNKITLNYRVLELMIIRRVVSLDGRGTNLWFGISNSRLQNIVNIEQDFVLHFYAFGLVGMLVTLMFYYRSVFRCIKVVWTTKTFVDFAILCCLGLFIVGSFWSGNNVNFLASTIPLAFIVSFSGKFRD